MWNLFDVIYIGCKSLETRNFQLSLINFSFRYKIVESENIKVRVLIEVVRVRRIELITSKMTEISSLPEEMLLHIFSFLPTSSLISVWRTSKQWRYLSRRPLAASIQSSWADPSYYPDSAEVHCAAALVTSGYLAEDVMTKLATRIQSSWYRHYPSVAAVRCAAALAATGHLTSVEWMVLSDLELPSTEDMPSLARVSSKVHLDRVTGELGPLLFSLNCAELLIEDIELDHAATSRGVSSGVVLDRVTGDLGPLLSSLTCTELWIDNMELDQAATSSLVRGLQHGVETLVLGSGVRLHIQTLLDYDGRGRCGQLQCHGDAWDTYKKMMKTWAAWVGWGVKKKNDWTVILRQNPSACALS